MKKIIALLLVVCLLMVSPLMAFAEKPEMPGKPSHVVTPLYLNIGDSIAYGMSAAPGKSYYDLFADYLNNGPAMNLGVPGATTGDLLESLSTKEFQKAVGRADIITISIGGNNLLKPVIQSLSGLMGITPEALVSIHDNPVALQEAFAVAAATLSMYYGFNPMEDDLIQAIVDYVIMEAGPGLIAGANTFTAEWPAIYTTIRNLNPHATIVPLTIINPFFHSGNDTLTGAFHGLADPLNGFLQSYGMMENTYVVDANPGFFMSPGAVAFNLNMTVPNLDIHPTTMGHSIIFALLAPLAEFRAFQPGKPEGVGKGVESMVEVLEVSHDGGLPEAHDVTGEAFGGQVSQMAQENPQWLADHANGETPGLPTVHVEEMDEMLSGRAFGQAASSLAREYSGAMAQLARGR